jgi:DNA polymerase III alpha subunit
MDLLGNRALTEIGDTVRRVAEVTGGRTVPQIDPPPDGDAETARMLRAGDTLGLFQLESPGMRNLLVMLDATTLDDAIDALALIRPGPAGAGMKELYVRRKRGLEPVLYAHPRLEKLLAPQRGILLYEEDVMCVVAALCDATLAQGDLFRRALAGTRTAEERQPLARWFAHRAMASGLPLEEARAAWHEVARFGAYSFCRAHAAGYGVLAWQAAYLRAHWPAAFAVSLADHHAGMYALWVHQADLARHGVRFTLPCINRSAAGFTLEGDPVAGPVRVGLARVRDLTERTLAMTLEARSANGPFGSLADWLGRVRPREEEAERLVRAGAFDFTGRTRASLLLELAATRTAYRHAEDEGAFRVRVSPLETPDLPEFEPVARLAHEWNALELGVTAHPLAAFAPGLWPADRPARAEEGDGPRGYDAARTLGAKVGRRVRLTGLAAACRRVPTKSGQRMFFLTLDDGTGLAECTLFPAAFGRSAHVFTGLGPYVVEGRVESQYGAVTVNVESCTRLAPLGSAAGRPAEAPRRPAGKPHDQEVAIVEKSW